MSRFQTGDKIIVKPQNNVYTVLAGAGLLAVVIALVTLYLNASFAGMKILPF
jgi:hypothetical protein